MSEIVSVPYRGATFLNVSEERWEVQEAWDKFPSPIGELHFSIDSNDLSELMANRFPSPIGELHFSIIKVIHYNTLQRV